MDQPQRRRTDDDTVVLTFPALAAFTDVAQTAVEELANRVGFAKVHVDQLSRAVAETLALLGDHKLADRTRIWLDADQESIAVEAAPLLAEALDPLLALALPALERFHSGLDHLVDLVAVDIGSGVVRFVKIASTGLPEIESTGAGSAEGAESG